MKKLLLILSAIFCFFGMFAQQLDSTWQAKNLSINSVADDYGPFLVDSMLLFTSMRRNSLEDKLLEYTEKVYYTLVVDTSFGKIKKFSYKANSDANSALVGCSDSNFFFYQSYFPDNGEIFVAPRKQEIYIKQLKKIPFILSDWDENSIATKGDSLYFTSNRSGNYDIYFQVGTNKPIPVDTLNSPFDEVGLWISPSGRELYFSSNRDGTFDIYCSNLIDEIWEEPQKLPYPINTEFDDQDYRQYNDSTIYFASNRSNGIGGYDIYQLIKPKLIAPPDTTIVQLDSIPVQDSLPDITKQIVEEVPIDSLPPRQQLIVKINEFGLDSIKAEIQLGAYQKYLTDIILFKKRFPCVKEENIRMDIFDQIDESPLRKFIIDQVFDDINLAIDKQISIVDKECFPTQPQGSIPFIALLKSGSRYAIFWSKGTIKAKEEFWILKDGEEIWRSK
ncbi:MAG: hypothetical protein PHR61_00290 [Candidatus Absconditabacteria bacterium]|nr:hypothetical protein [Candidatus Absconditabacteria bacterium]